MTVATDWSAISLLWPPNVDRVAPQLSAACLNDLDLERIVTVMATGHGFAAPLRAILQTLVTDPVVINYRQAMLADVIHVPELAKGLRELLPTVIALDQFAYLGGRDQSALHEIVWRVGQLESYVGVIDGLAAIFQVAGGRVQAAGWVQLRQVVHAVQSEPTFKHLKEQLPALVKQVRNIASITIGVNLDEHLRPVAATLLAVNARKFRGESPSLLTLLFGRTETQNNGDPYEGIAPLRTSEAGFGAGLFSNGDTVPENPMLHPLFRDLAEVVRRTSRPVAVALQKYMRLNVSLLGGLGVEIAFYLGAAYLVEELSVAGLPVCRPEILEPDARECVIESTYNLNLALRVMHTRNMPPAGEIVVTNHVAFGPEGRIFVLTGPNHGGKTTYTQAIGLVQVLAQAGLFVPGSRARISPVDDIFTHFPVEERPDSEAGRLGEEAQRLNEIFAAATAHSLVLLNESLSSTSPGESLYLAQDIMRILRRMGVRAVFATHLHELAAGVDELNATTPGDSVIASLVAQVAENGHRTESGIRQTYEIVPGPPRGHSYAREIAAQYGISYEQLIALLRRRGLVDGE